MLQYHIMEITLCAKTRACILIDSDGFGYNLKFLQFSTGVHSQVHQLESQNWQPTTWMDHVPRNCDMSIWKGIQVGSFQ